MKMHIICNEIWLDDNLVSFTKMISSVACGDREVYFQRIADLEKL